LKPESPGLLKIKKIRKIKKVTNDFFKQSFFACALIASLTVIVSACSGKAPVDIQKSLPQVGAADFDPAKRSKRVDEDLEGYTEWLFSCTAKFDYDTVASDDTAGGATCELKIKAVHLKLALPITVHIPKNVDPAVKKHENGHVQICSLTYGRADKAAYDAASQVIGQTYSGNGATLAEAREMALRQPEKIIAIDFQDEVSVICDQASAKYEEFCRRDEGDPNIDCAKLARQAYAEIDSIKSVPIK
jgi:hypothetical protein